jgi:hypothetical protein
MIIESALCSIRKQKRLDQQQVSLFPTPTRRGISADDHKPCNLTGLPQRRLGALNGVARQGESPYSSILHVSLLISHVVSYRQKDTDGPTETGVELRLLPPAAKYVVIRQLESAYFYWSRHSFGKKSH